MFVPVPHIVLPTTGPQHASQEQLALLGVAMDKL
jgi:hypothetical protein